MHLPVSGLIDFRFGAFVKEYKLETKEELTFGDLAGTHTATPSECMLLLEMTRKNQTKVSRFHQLDNKNVPLILYSAGSFWLNCKGLKLSGRDTITRYEFRKGRNPNVIDRNVFNKPCFA